MKKEKLTIEQQIRTRKYKIPKGFMWGVYSLVCNWFVEPKYKAHYEMIDNPKDCDGPCIIIWNHQSRRDYLFVKRGIQPRKFNMVAGYSEFHRKKFVFPFKVAGVLPKKNFCVDPYGIKAMTSIIKQGGCVVFAPEGTSSIYGCQQPIIPGTGRLLQFFNVPVYFMHMEGAYLSSHKVYIKDRPGRVNIKCTLLFKKDETKSMTVQEIDDRINEVFKHDDYEWNKTARIKYKTKGTACERLDDIIYYCPKCGKEMTITAKGNKIVCTNCGNGATQDDYFDFHPLDDTCKIPVSPSAWYAVQRMKVIQDIRKDPNYSFTTHVKVGNLPLYKHIKKSSDITVYCGEGDMTFDHTGIHYRGTKEGQEWNFDLSYETYFNVNVENECDNFSVYIDSLFYTFTPNEKVTGKCILITEEMHRLHFNTWKNYPWNAFMYHGTELEVSNDNYEEEIKKLYL